MVQAHYFEALAWTILRRQRPRSQGERERVFQSLFGVAPIVCERAWFLCALHGVLPARTHPKHLLWALHFMKVYGTEAANAQVFLVDPKTFRQWIWKWIASIALLESHIILWANRFRNSNPGAVCFVTVDGTDFRILNPTPFWRGWFSHKFNGPGLRYEVAICIATGHIVWINGPFPCGKYADVTIFRQSLMHALRPGEKVEADGGYAGCPQHVCLPHHPVPARRVLKQRVRSRHETVNGRFKHFNVLSDVYRHNLRDHSKIFRAVAVLTQLSFENGSPPYQIHNYV